MIECKSIFELANLNECESMLTCEGRDILNRGLPLLLRRADLQPHLLMVSPKVANIHVLSGWGRASRQAVTTVQRSPRPTTKGHWKESNVFLARFLAVISPGALKQQRVQAVLGFGFCLLHFKCLAAEHRRNTSMNDNTCTACHKGFDRQQGSLCRCTIVGAVAWQRRSSAMNVIT